MARKTRRPSRKRILTPDESRLARKVRRDSMFGLRDTGRRVYGASATLAVDPGAHGSVAWICRESRLWLGRIPAHWIEWRDMLRALVPARIVIEDPNFVGSKMGGVDSIGMALGAAKTVGIQAFQLGWLRAVPEVLDFTVEMVQPKEWQKCLKAKLPKDYMERKRYIRDCVAVSVPSVSLTQADGCAIALWKSGWTCPHPPTAEDLI